MKTDAISGQVARTGSVPYTEAFDERRPPSLSMPLLESAGDFILLLAGSMLGGTLAELLQRSHSLSVSPSQLFVISAVYAGLCVCLLQGEHAYPRVCSLLHIKETQIVLRVSIQAILIFLVAFALARYPVPRTTTLMAWVISTLALARGRLWVYEIVRKYYASAFPKRRTLIYGTKRTARRFFTGALHSPWLGIEPVGFVESGAETSDAIYSNDYYHRNLKPVFHEPLSVDLLQKLQVKDLFVCDPEISDQDLARVREVAEEAECSISLVDNQEILTTRSPMWVWEMDGLLVATTILNQPGRLYSASKRALDIFCSAILILVCAPVGAVLALFVKFGSKGPVFFSQTRIGKDGKPFEILKFRSMKVDAPKYAVSPAHNEDPRITPVGRFMRKTSLDELPQLINVLMGDMSLVGPRPEMPYITEGYGPAEATRLTVQQGITGLWQLSADRRYAIHESIEYDLYYIQNRTLLMDIAILLHTLVYAAKGI